LAEYVAGDIHNKFSRLQRRADLICTSIFEFIEAPQSASRRQNICVIVGTGQLRRRIRGAISF